MKIKDNNFNSFSQLITEWKQRCYQYRKNSKESHNCGREDVSLILFGHGCELHQCIYDLERLFSNLQEQVRTVHKDFCSYKEKYTQGDPFQDDSQNDGNIVDKIDKQVQKVLSDSIQED